MQILKSIASTSMLLFSPALWAHPGHPSVSLDHSHAAQGFDLQYAILLIAIISTILAVGYTFRCLRRGRTPR